MSARAAASIALALLSSAMLGLAAGAIWTVASLYMRQPAPWLVLPIGAALAWATRAGVHPPGNVAALLAALATGLAAIYTAMLLAGLQIASLMGLGLFSALHSAGIPMLWQLSKLATTPSDLAWFGLGIVVAAWLAWRAPRKR
ncbi:MAG: hypothetical protein ABI114_17840 [Rhodanobacter sp.]